MTSQATTGSRRTAAWRRATARPQQARVVLRPGAVQPPGGDLDLLGDGIIMCGHLGRRGSLCPFIASAPSAALPHDGLSHVGPDRVYMKPPRSVDRMAARVQRGAWRCI